MEFPVNFKMAAHPINWFVIALMLVIAGAIGHYTMSLFGVEPKTEASNFDKVSPGISVIATE